MAEKTTTRLAETILEMLEGSNMAMLSEGYILKRLRERGYPDEVRARAAIAELVLHGLAATGERGLACVDGTAWVWTLVTSADQIRERARRGARS